MSHPGVVQAVDGRAVVGQRIQAVAGDAHDSVNNIRSNAQSQEPIRKHSQGDSLAAGSGTP